MLCLHDQTFVRAISPPPLQQTINECPVPSPPEHCIQTMHSKWMLLQTKYSKWMLHGKIRLTRKVQMVILTCACLRAHLTNSPNWIGQDEGREKDSCDVQHLKIKPPDNKAGVSSDSSSRAASATLKPGTTALAQSLRRSKRTASKPLSDDFVYSRADLSVGGSWTPAPLPRVTAGKSQGVPSSPLKPTPWVCNFFDASMLPCVHR